MRNLEMILWNMQTRDNKMAETKNNKHDHNLTTGFIDGKQIGRRRFAIVAHVVDRMVANLPDNFNWDDHTLQLAIIPNRLTQDGNNENF